MHSLILTVVVVLGLAELDRRRNGDGYRRIEGWLTHRYAPGVAGLVTAILVALTWGDLTAPGGYHDERAYLVQARLLAAFSWSAPSPPIPMAWEMAHVFVEPAIFAKYPPGHSLVLVPGIWLGLPALIPTLLAGIAGGLLFAVVRRVSDGWSAALGWAVWTTSASALTWHASYFSETTTTVLWLGLLLALLAWVERDRAWLFIGMTAAVAFMGITRPVTGVALAVPILVVVLWTTWKRRVLAGWPQAAVVGLLICSLVPYWSWRTTGSPTQLPYPHYSAVYFPFDMPGFVRDTSPPLRELPPDLIHLADVAKVGYQDHHPSRVPANFLLRSRSVIDESLGPGRSPLLVAVPLAALVLGVGKMVFLTASFVLLIAGYLSMPHTPGWTVYYLEVYPIVPALVAIGLVSGVANLRQRIRTSRRWAQLPAKGYVVMGLGLAAFVSLPQELATRSFFRALARERQSDAREMIAQIPEKNVVVFVRRTTRQSPHFTLFDILGKPATTPVWIVRDLGDSTNAALLEAAGTRVPYLLNEGEMTLIPYPTHRLPRFGAAERPDTASGSATTQAGP